MDFIEFVKSEFKFGEIITREKFFSFGDRIDEIYALDGDEIEEMSLIAANTFDFIREQPYSIWTHHFWACVSYIMFHDM